MVSATPARYKKFPSLTNPVLPKSPENQQILRNLKDLYDNHSKNWDERTRYNIIDHVLNGDTEVTERIARVPGRHKLLQRNMTFAIWIVLRATYGIDRLSRIQYRFFEKFPGIDPASLVSPVLAKKTKASSQGEEEDGEDDALPPPAPPPPPPPPRAPSIFGPVDVSKFTYRHEQDDSQKRKRLDAASFQPWKIPKTTVKREPDFANFSAALCPPAFPQVYLLPTEESRNMTSPVDNAPLPSIESPYGSLDSEHDNSLSQQDKENCIPPLRPPFQSPAHASRSVQSIESGNIGSSPSLSSSQIPSLIEQCRKFDAEIRKLQTDIDKMRKERQEERRNFIETIASIRDEIRADMGYSQEPTILTKTAKVNTAMTEYNNATRTLRASLNTLASELSKKPEQDKPSLGLKKTVDDLNKSMGAVGTIFEARQKEFRSQVKALDEATD